MIKRADIKDANLLAALAIQMRKEHTLSDLADEFREIIEKDDAVCFIKYVDDKLVSFGRVSSDTTTLKEQKVLPSDIWKESLLQKNIVSKDTLQSFWLNAKSGPKKKAAIM